MTISSVAHSKHCPACHPICINALVFQVLLDSVYWCVRSLVSVHLCNMVISYLLMICTTRTTSIMCSFYGNKVYNSVCVTCYLRVCVCDITMVCFNVSPFKATFRNVSRYNGIRWYFKVLQDFSWKLPCYIRISVAFYRVQKQRNIKSWNLL